MRFQIQEELKLPASICGFFVVDCSSTGSTVGFLNITGALAIEPGVEVLVGSSRFAYSDRPPGRGVGFGLLF